MLEGLYITMLVNEDKTSCFNWVDGLTEAVFLQAAIRGQTGKQTTEEEEETQRMQQVLAKI
jgi:hypothetical protein